MLALSIDEFTLMFLVEECDFYEWQHKAKVIIEDVEQRLFLTNTFGKRQDFKKPQRGYTKAYTWGNNIFYIAMSFNESSPRMGLCLRFSAQAWHYYQSKMKLELFQVLQMLQSSRYTVRMSRCDVVADYIDEGMTVEKIAEDLAQGRVNVYTTRANGEQLVKPSRREIRKNDVIQTLYVGNKETGRAYLRIYDKRAEQLETKGADLFKAKDSRDWVRFELVLRYDYAHKITDDFKTCHSVGEFEKMLAGTLISRFNFYNTEGGIIKEQTEYSAKLAGKSGGYRLRNHFQVRDFSLSSSIANILKNSGLCAVLYKLDSSFGSGASAEFLAYVLKQYHLNYKPTRDHVAWVKSYAKNLRDTYADFNDYEQRELRKMI